MVLISKHLFYEKAAKNLKCSDFHSWGDDCIKSHVWLFPNVFTGTFKFFLPIYIVKAIINHKKLKDNHFLKKLLLEQIRSTIYATIYAHLLVISHCLLFKLSGQGSYYNIALVPGMIAGMSLLVESNENKTLDTIIGFNLIIEAILRNVNHFNIIKLTSIRETLMFMIVSALLMHVLQNRKKNLRLPSFWFYIPDKYPENQNEITKNNLKQKCNHKETCLEFALWGTQKYFFLGYVFSVVKKLIPRMLNVLKKPQKLFGIFVNKDNMKFGLFIGTYVGLYRYIICYFLKTKSINQKYFGAIAGLVSGATYSISPNIQVLTVGITFLLQIFHHHTSESLQIKNQKIHQQAVFMLISGFLFHNAVMSRETCPSYYINALESCTSNLFGETYKRVLEKIGII